MTLLRRYENFFSELNDRLSAPLGIVLTGGAAALLYGGHRPTEDLDFAIRHSGKSSWEKDALVLNELSKKHGLPLQYSEDIGRWTMISLLDWREHALPYKDFGRLSVRLLHPKHWSIGKVARGYQTDVEDLVVVLKKQKITAEEIIPFWAEALRKSEPSSELFIAKKLVEDFLAHEGRKVWGKSFDPKDALKIFLENLGQKRKK